MARAMTTPRNAIDVGRDADAVGVANDFTS
jgi:hypothetical protein